MRVRRVRAVARRESIHILRDPRSLVVAFLLPVVMLLLYGHGINLDVRHIRTAVLDLDNTRDSREYADALVHGGSFDVVERPATYRALTDLLDRTAVRCALVLPRGFARDAASGAGTAQLLVDGSDATTGMLAISYASGAARQVARTRASLAAVRSGRPAPPAPIDLRVRTWYNRDLRSSDFIVPGLAAVILAMLSALLTSMTIVRERERGTMEQVLASPVRPAELMLGKLAPYVILASIDIVLVIEGGRLLFGVPARGSLGVLAVASLFFLVASLGLGLLVSTLARTQLVAMMVAVTATMLPTILLSGFVFPIATMPPAAQVVTCVIPARHYLVVVRGVLLKGVGTEVLWPQIAVLAFMAVATIGASAARFRRTL